MKKYRIMLLCLPLLLFMIACQDSEFTVTLLVDDEVYETYTVEVDQDFSLPEYSTDVNYIYVGWEDEEALYQGDITITSDLELTLCLEEVEEVFTFSQDEETGFYTLNSYTGNALYLRVPSTYNDEYIVSIDTEAFMDSDIVEVYLPCSIMEIKESAFYQMAALEKVEFYGELDGESTVIIGQEVLYAYFEEYVDTCIVDSYDNDNVYYYNSACPIKQASVDSIELIEGVSYRTYSIIIEDSVYFATLNIAEAAFYDCNESLEVLLPNGDALFTEGIYNTPA